MAAAPPQISSIDIVKTPQGLDLVITGYSVLRRVTGADFNFDVRNGNKTQHITMSRNVDTLFASWFQNPASVSFGSAFSFTQSVGIQGAGSIDTITVVLKNAQGNSTQIVVHP